MQITVDLPEELAQRLNLYLQEHPEESLLGILKEALEIKLVPKDTSRLLELAGIVTDAPRGADDHAEDDVA
jgi:hypothetical protein